MAWRNHSVELTRGNVAVLVIEYTTDQAGNGICDLVITASPGCAVDEEMPMALRIARYLKDHLRDHIQEALKQFAH